MAKHGLMTLPPSFLRAIAPRHLRTRLRRHGRPSKTRPPGIDWNLFGIHCKTIHLAYGLPEVAGMVTIISPSSPRTRTTTAWLPPLDANVAAKYPAMARSTGSFSCGWAPADNFND